MSASQHTAQSPKKVPHVSDLPNEVLDLIITSLISITTPVHLEYLIKTANQLTAFDLFHSRSTAHEKFSPSQLQHQREWVILNSVCRRWRIAGIKAFWNRKTFVITTTLLKALQAGQHPTLTATGHPFRILQNIRHVNAPMSGGGSIPGDFLILPRYPQAFANLRRLDIMTGVSKNDILHECCVPHFWAYACEKDSYRELMDHLADMGLQTEGLDIRFPCETTPPAGDFRMQNIRRYVLPHLQFVARQKAKLQAEVAGERRG